MKVRNFFEDGKGWVVFWQAPNFLLWAWIVATVLSKIVTSGKVHDFLGVIAFGSIFAWAYLEITQGATPFRRALGAVVLVAAILSRLN